MSKLASYSYGKDLVRLLRVVRDPKNPASHQIAEYTVRVLLTGPALETSYTQADNSLVVPTDTVKNTVNVLAKELDGESIVLVPEAFALHLGWHFLSKYAHVTGVTVDIDSHRWSRIDLGADAGGVHQHSFVRDGDSIRTVALKMSKSKAGGWDGATEATTIKVDSLTGGVKNLLVLKSTGSAFHGFHLDELTTLIPTNDRIFSTAVECIYTIEVPHPLETFLTPSIFSTPTPSKDASAPSKKPFQSPIDFNKLHTRVLAHTFRLFATDASASVQATLFKMASEILAEPGVCADFVSSVEYTLPNKHYVPVDLGFVADRLGGDNNLGEGKAEVFLPQANPSGLIKAKIVKA
ncbi:hypothetical protein V8E36_008399 [Tilletia maclaganii]